MKTIREVTEITGLTRKALRGYDEKRILHPTAKDERGRWLYDDAAIIKLLAISICAEVGYTREEIKDVLDKPAEEAKAIQDELIDKLEEKKRRIEGMINMIRLNRFLLSLPEKVINIVLSIGFSDILSGKTEKNYKEAFSEMVDDCADDEEFDLLNAELGVLISGYTLLLGRVKTNNPAHKAVQKYVTGFFDRYYTEVKKYYEANGAETDRAETNAFLAKYLEESLHDPEEMELYEGYCKPGYAGFILKAVSVYLENTDDENKKVVEDGQ